MTLIIDEQLIQYTGEDFEKACVNLIRNQKYAFQEIFVYSGHYSNNDGKEASFDIYPIKAPRDMMLQKIQKI